MYRQKGAARQPRVVEYGRFPVRRGRAAFALLAIGLGAIQFLVLTSSRELICERSAAARCSLTQNGLLGSRGSHFSPSAVNEVRAGTRTGKGNRITAHTVVLVDQRGAETSFAWSDEAEAKQAFLAAERFFAKGSSEQALRLVEQPSVWGLVFALGFAGVGLWLGVDALRGSGSWRIEIDLDAQRVTSRPSRLGWPGRTLVHSLEGVRDVRLVHSALYDRFKTRGQHDEAATRPVLSSRHAGELPLTTGLLRSSSPRLSALHERKRRELLAALDMPAESEPESASEPDEKGLAARWARLPKATRTLIVFFASILGVAVIGQNVLLAYTARTQGFLEVQCSRRCRFAGAECLPGGSFGMALDPGTHTLEVYDPGSPGNWQPLEVTIIRGETVKLDCRPR